MRSKTSYFNPTLFRKNLTRFWPLWGGASFIGALFPLAFLTILLREHALFGGPMSDPLEITRGYYGIVSWIIPTLSLLYAALCALAAWGWLYNPRSVGMYHSLPVTRKGIFLTDFLSGMAMMLLPYAVTGTLSILVSAAAGGVEPVGLAVTILSVLGMSFFYFASATAVVFITGNPFAFAAFYFIFHFIAAGLEWLVTQLMTLFYFGVERSYQGVIEFLSPTMYLTSQLEATGKYQQITTAEGWVESGKLEYVKLENTYLIAVYALVGVALLAFAWGLYRRRRSESAGDVVAVGWMKPVFRYGVALCAAFAGGMALYLLFFEDYRTTAAALPMAVCMAIAGLVGYYIASMLLAKSFRVFRGSWKGALATLLASAALCFTVAADPFGVETWVPREGEVQQVRLWIGGWNSPNIYVILKNPAAIQEVLALHQTVVSERETLDRNRFEGETHYAYLDLDYYKNEVGDGLINRCYNLPCNDILMEKSEALRKLAALASDPRIQERSIFSNVSGEEIESRLIGGYAAGLYNTETKEMEQVDLTLEQAKVLEAAVRRDIQAGHFGRTLFMLNDSYEKAVYTGDLDLHYSVTSLTGRWTGRSTRSVSLSLSVYATETLKALEDLGIVSETRRFLTYVERDALDNEEKGLPYAEYDDPYSCSSSIVYPQDAYIYPEETF